MMRDKLRSVIVLMLLMVSIQCVSNAAEVPGKIDFQGRLTGTTGTPVSGTKNFTFSVWDSLSGGSQLWTETQSNVSVANGVFNVKLGNSNQISADLFSATTRYLQIQVESETLSPRQQLITVPYAFYSMKSYGVVDSAITSGSIVNNTIIRDDIANDVVSNTLVANLNADLVDGQHASSFLSTAGGWLNGPVSFGDGYSLYIGTAGTGYLNVGGGTVGVLKVGTGGSGQIEVGTNYFYMDADDLMNKGTNLYLQRKNQGAATAGQVVLGDAATRTDFYITKGTMVFLLDSVNGSIRESNSLCFDAWNATPSQSEFEGGWNINARWDGSYYNLRFYRSTGVHFRFRHDGTAFCTVAWTNGGADYAEVFPVKETTLEPGDVVVIDPDDKNKLKRATNANATNIAGVISTKPGVVGNWPGTETNELPSGQKIVSLMGQVPCKVTAINGPIKSGDMLTSSSIPGYAMKSTELKLGTIVGKALEPLESGTGKINILVYLH
jgi:hypothetical protein